MRMTTTSLIRFLLLLAVLSCLPEAPALNLNLPYGTLNADFSVTTRVGTFPKSRQKRSATGPATGRVAAYFRGSGIFIIDLNTVRGTVNAARVFRSTGSREVDNILIDTLQQWRIQPRTIYKLHVPVTVTSRGRFVFGEGGWCGCRSPRGPRGV